MRGSPRCEPPTTDLRPPTTRPSAVLGVARPPPSGAAARAAATVPTYNLHGCEGRRDHGPPGARSAHRGLSVVPGCGRPLRVHAVVGGGGPAGSVRARGRLRPARGAA